MTVMAEPIFQVKVYVVEATMLFNIGMLVKCGTPQLLWLWF